jgi:hypothetical protein
MASSVWNRGPGTFQAFTMASEEQEGFAPTQGIAD